MKRVCILFNLLLGLALLANAIPAGAQREGIQAIGLSRYSNHSVDLMVQLLVQSDNDQEVTFAPFDFVHPGDDPFGKASRLVHGALSPMWPDLYMTVYLTTSKWSKIDWTSFQKDEVGYLTRSGFLSRLNQFDTWVKNMTAFASSLGMQQYLHFVVVPELEDKCTSPQLFQDLLNQMKAQQARDGVSTHMRRSPMGGYAGYIFRLSGVPMEWHGANPNISAMGWGDVWSNDGNSLDSGQFTGRADHLLSIGISCIFWNHLYNGVSSDTGDTNLPDQRPYPLDPLSSPTLYTWTSQAINYW